MIEDLNKNRECHREDRKVDSTNKRMKKREKKRWSFSSDSFPYIGVNPINGLLTDARTTEPATSGERDGDSGHAGEGKRALVSRGGSSRIDRRTGIWRAALPEGRTGCRSVRGLFGRRTLTRGPVVHMHRTLAGVGKGGAEASWSDRGRDGR